MIYSARFSYSLRAGCYSFSVPPSVLTFRIATNLVKTTVFPTFVNVATLFILSGTFFKLLKDYKARYMGIGKVDKDMALFYEDKKEKEEK